VLHDIQDRQRYILGGCVDDLWLGVSALLELFPETLGRIGYMGISFGGGIGALALPADPRIRLAHLNVPTFGHMPIRLSLPTLGSGEAVRAHRDRHGHVLDTLQYYDAATAATFCRIPVHVAAALFDPVVAPPGQFAIHNALAAPKRLFVLDGGHFQYPGQADQERRLLEDLREFFSLL
jgi:cephalosporin-C deacetylase